MGVRLTCYHALVFAFTSLAVIIEHICYGKETFPFNPNLWILLPPANATIFVTIILSEYILFSGDAILRNWPVGSSNTDDAGKPFPRLAGTKNVSWNWYQIRKRQHSTIENIFRNSNTDFSFTIGSCVKGILKKRTFTKWKRFTNRKEMSSRGKEHLVVSFRTLVLFFTIVQRRFPLLLLTVVFWTQTYLVGMRRLSTTTGEIHV